MKTLNKLPLTISETRHDTSLPKDGDAIVICRSDGTTDFLILGTGHMDLRARFARGEDLSDKEMSQLEAVFMAMTLFIASKNEAVMDALSDMVADPNVIDPATISSLN